MVGEDGWLRRVKGWLVGWMVGTSRGLDQRGRTLASPGPATKWTLRWKDNYAISNKRRAREE